MNTKFASVLVAAFVAILSTIVHVSQRWNEIALNDLHTPSFTYYGLVNSFHRK